MRKTLKAHFYWCCGIPYKLLLLASQTTPLGIDGACPRREPSLDYLNFTMNTINQACPIDKDLHIFQLIQ